MNPPAEQLIRDYLNRVSVAARGKLSSAERRELLDRMHAELELETRKPGGADPAAVQRLLRALGKPETLVELECARLELGSGQPGQRAGGTGGVLARLAGRLPHRHAAAGSGAHTSASDTSASDTSASDTSASDTSASDTSASDTSASDTSASDTSASDTSASDTSAADTSAANAGESAASEPSASGQNSDWFLWSLRPAAGQRDQPGLAPTTESAEPERTDAPAAENPAAELAAQLGRLANATVRLARQHPLEATAVLLLGLGGLIYPPIWLLGAGVALFSKQWDGLDKWAGLVGPPLVVIVGAGLDVALGGKQHDSISAYAHEAWIFGDHLARLVAVIGAGFLTWRVTRGPRAPAAPPWDGRQRAGGHRPRRA